jgi:hypothetical protein
MRAKRIKEYNMNPFARAVVVFLLAFSLVAAQSSELFAQSQGSAPVATLDNLIALGSSAKTPAAFSSRLSFDPTPMAVPAQASGSSSRKWFFIAGLAMVGAGTVMAVRKEPIHQTTCITYDACPTPGLVRVTGGIMAATGASIILFKLKGD